MSDQRLRALEREWLESGDPEQGELYLRARFNAGTIDWPRVEAAAYLGDAACARLLGEDALAFESGGTKSLAKFVSGLVPYGSRHPGIHRRVRLGMVRGASRALRDHECAPALKAAIDAVELGLGQADPEVARPYLRDVQRLESFGDVRLLRTLHGELVQLSRSREEIHSTPLVRRAAEEGWNSRDLREGIQSIVMPWLLSETAVPSPDWRRDAPFLEGPEQFAALQAVRAARLTDVDPEPLYHGGPIDPAQAQALNANRPSGKLKTADASRLIATYYCSLGWKHERGRLLAPSGLRRFDLKSRVVVIEVKTEQGWRKKASHFDRSVRLLHVAELLLAAAEAARSG